MEKKKTSNMAALISIEPGLVRMRLSKLKNDALVDVDRLEKQTKLGHEIFNNKKISFGTLREISGILRNYSSVLKEYNIKNCRVIACALLREAENCAYIVDQIKIQNDMNVRILEDRQEKSLVYFEILCALQSSKYKNLDKTLISYIGAGNIGFSIYDREKILFSQNIDMGSSKLYELLEPVREQTADFSLVVEEYLERMIGRIKFPLDNSEIENLIVSGSEISLIANLCGAKEVDGIYDISPSAVNGLYDQIKNISVQAISDRYDVSVKNAQLLFTALAIYSRILKMTNAKRILSPKVELWDAVMKQILSSKIEKKFEEHIGVSAIFCAKVLSYHFYFSQEHIEATHHYATLIFDSLKKLHGLDKRKKLFLDLAVMLHEVGYYVNSKDPRASTFDIIKNVDLYGLTEADVLLFANIVRYNELTTPTLEDAEYRRLTDSERLLVSKLVAIFRLSNALDKSKKQKLKNIKIKVLDESLVITAESDDNVYLEKWAVAKCSEFFEEVFGLKVRLDVKSGLI